MAGLAAGMTCCFLIALWVLDEIGYDPFHEKSSAIYGVEFDQYYSGRSIKYPHIYF
jgi:putative ABC transport system permease protein